MWIICSLVRASPTHLLKACFRSLTPSASGALHLAKYEYTLTLLGNPSGDMRHWQPPLSKESTTLKTSYKFTMRSLVRLCPPFWNESIRPAPGSQRFGTAFLAPCSLIGAPKMLTQIAARTLSLQQDHKS